MNIFSKRLARLEAATTQKPATTIVVLVEPEPGAGEADLQNHRAELDCARENGYQVHLVSSLNPIPNGWDGVEVFGTLWEAHFAAMAKMPSTSGNRNALEDLLRDTAGNVIGVVANPVGNDGLELGALDSKHTTEPSCGPG